MASYGPVHRLIVREVGERITLYWDADEFEDYEIGHPPQCKPSPPDEWAAPSHDCAVADQVWSTGCRWSLAYSGCLINEPGEYLIQAWAETIRGYDFTEYDGGIGLYDGEGGC